MSRLLIICLTVALFLGALLWRIGAPDDLGCQVVQEMNGWRSCETLNHYVIGVAFYGCSEADGHAYKFGRCGCTGRVLRSV